MSKIYFVFFIFIPTLALLAFLGRRSAKIMSLFSGRDSHAVSGGHEAARGLLNHLNYYDIRVERGANEMTSFYDFRKKAVVLCPYDYESRSITAVGRALHQSGHAIEHMQGSGTVLIKGWLGPFFRSAGLISVGLIPLSFFPMLGVLFSLGAVFFCLYVIFALGLLPLELAASRRASASVHKLGHFSAEEARLIQRVLEAAALSSLVRIPNIFFRFWRAYVP